MSQHQGVRHDEELRSWFRRLRLWLARFVGIKRASDYRRPRILKSLDRTYVRLLLLEPDYADKKFERIAVWRCVFRQPKPYDLVITCDRFRYTHSQLLRVELRTDPYPAASHRLSVLRVGNSAVGGRIRTDCLFLCDANFLAVNRGLDGYAPVITASMAVQLSKRSLEDLDKLTRFEDNAGNEIAGMRRTIWYRWLDVFNAYGAEYFLGGIEIDDRQISPPQAL